jgi:hypothetical protein
MNRSARELCRRSLPKEIVTLVLVCVLLVACSSKESDCLEFLDGHALRFPTYHVQGLAVTSDAYYVTSVDREAEQGWLFQVNRDSLSVQTKKELTKGALIHPGGIHMDGNYLCLYFAH